MPPILAEHSPPYGVMPADGAAAFTVDGFCRSHHVSRSKLYQMWREGIGPRIMRIGAKVLISTEAAADWRREREAAAIADGQEVA